MPTKNMHIRTALKYGNENDPCIPMYSHGTIALKYLRHLSTASSGKGHGIHSPFVFEFVTRVLNDRTAYPAYDRIEQLRKKLLQDATPVPTEEYGAGSLSSGPSRSVASIARGSAKSPRYAQLLFRIAQYYHAGYIIELGTSLGISAAYLGSASGESAVITGEGNHVLSATARNNFDRLGIRNVKVVTGNFDNTLPEMLQSVPHVDLAFIDGNHREEPTLRYFNTILPALSSSSALVFDDIHWSREMESAWGRILAHPSVMMSVDLFFLGIVFFRPDFLVKQHFRIRF